MIIGILAGSTASHLWANDIFEYHGPFNRAYGGAGIAMGRGGEAVLLNPANLWTNWTSDAYVDGGLLNLKYTLTPSDPNFSPGRVNIPVLPLPSAGGSLKLSNVAVGAMVLPTGIGSKSEVKDLPLFTGGQFQKVSAVSAQKGFKVGLGAAYKVTSRFYVGLSAVHDRYSSESTIALTETDTIKSKYKWQYTRPIVGMRYRMRNLGTLAFSYQQGKQYPYDLEIQAFSEPPQIVNLINYRAEVYGIGMVTKAVARFGFFGQYTYEKWLKAREFAKTPNQALTSSAPVEFRSTDNFVVGTRYRLTRKGLLSFAYSYYGGNKGPGALDENGEIILSGRGPQDFEALSRDQYTLSFESIGKSSNQLFYLTSIEGVGLNPEGAPNPYLYNLKIILAGYALVLR